MKQLKIKLLRKLIWLWDVTFTAIDNFQLKMWVKMKTKLEDIENNN